MRWSSRPAHHGSGGNAFFLLRLLHVGRMPSLAAAALSCSISALVTGMSPPMVRAAGGFTLF